LSRALGSITDPIAGMVATREGSIEDTIESTQNQINAMELRLELKRSTLLRQFTAMEQAIAELNSTGSFLGSQLASLGGAASTS
jgi:flagellar hook-associated protein 2